jgi:hypothetical protein
LSVSCLESNRSRKISDETQFDSIRIIEKKIYQAEIRLITEINNRIIEIPFGRSDTDYDQSFNCEVGIDSRSFLNYEIQGMTLVLTDDQGSYLFERKSTESGHELNGVWLRTYTENNSKINLYLEFTDGNLKITKKCVLN